MQNSDLARQFRVLKQSINIHADLSNVYKKKALFLDLILLIGSTLLVATVFMDDKLLSPFLSDKQVKLLIGLFSIIIFTGSLFSLLVNWKELSNRHLDAVKKLTKVSALFRKHKDEVSNSWPEECHELLNEKYWETCDSVINIPDDKFVKYKARYLRKLTFSKLSDQFSGCPILFLKLFLFFYLLFCCCVNNKCFREIVKKDLANDNEKPNFGKGTC